jgi:hypothetical protein
VIWKLHQPKGITDPPGSPVLGELTNEGDANCPALVLRVMTPPAPPVEIWVEVVLTVELEEFWEEGVAWVVVVVVVPPAPLVLAGDVVDAPAPPPDPSPAPPPAPVVPFASAIFEATVVVTVWFDVTEESRVFVVVEMTVVASVLIVVEVTVPTAVDVAVTVPVCVVVRVSVGPGTRSVVVVVASCVVVVVVPGKVSVTVDWVCASV